MTQSVELIFFFYEPRADPDLHFLWFLWLISFILCRKVEAARILWSVAFKTKGSVKDFQNFNYNYTI